MTNFKIKLRISLWFLLFLIITCLLWKGIAPTGKMTYVYDFKHGSDFISNLSPNDRLEVAQNGTQKVIGNPIYFSLRTPRKFNKAKMTLKYKNDELAIIEAGVLANQSAWRYILKPLQNRTIDQLASEWDITKNGDLMLLQRNKKYESVDEFLDNLPETNKIAVYNYNLQMDFVLDNYSSSTSEFINEEGEKEIEREFTSIHSLLGGYEFFTYVKDEKLDVRFTFYDLNKNDDLDNIDIFLYYNDQVIFSTHPKDKGEKEGTGSRGENIFENLEIPNLPEGVYKIVVNANNDIVTDAILIAQHKISFVNKINIYNELTKGEDSQHLDIFTDSNKLHFTTTHPDKLQEIKINEDKIVDINKTYKQFSSDSLEKPVSKVSMTKNGLMIAGDGVFAFSEEALINPKIKVVNENFSDEGVDYILAKYSVSKKKGDWTVSSVDFDISNIYRENGKNSFMISVPGFKADDEIDESFEIDEIKIELEGDSLGRKIKTKLKKIINE